MSRRGKRSVKQSASAPRLPSRTRLGIAGLALAAVVAGTALWLSRPLQSAAPGAFAGRKYEDRWRPKTASPDVKPGRARFPPTRSLESQTAGSRGSRSTLARSNEPPLRSRATTGPVGVRLRGSRGLEASSSAIARCSVRLRFSASRCKFAIDDLSWTMEGIARSSARRWEGEPERSRAEDDWSPRYSRLAVKEHDRRADPHLKVSDWLLG